MAACNRLFYGGDYNPDQWLDRPDILEKDIEMMKAAGINEVSVGIFAWAKLEPEDGKYSFDWLEKIITRLHENGIDSILATPSGARPHWLAEKYPSVLRTNAERQKDIFSGRHNHCLTSPDYRRKVHDIDLRLARRFAGHPAIIGWHISNEFSGECHCELCQQAFRQPDAEGRPPVVIPRNFIVEAEALRALAGKAAGEASGKIRQSLAQQGRAKFAVQPSSQFHALHGILL